MNNPFKNIIQNEKAPAALKSKVMNDIDLIKVSLDMADLVLIQYPSAIIELISPKTNKQ